MPKLTFLTNLYVATSIAISTSATPVWAQAANGDVSTHVNRGNALMAKSQFQQAIDEYEQAQAIEPGNSIVRDNIVLAHNNWGIAYFRQRKYDEAKAEFDKALALNPHDRNTLNNMAVLKKHVGAPAPVKAAPQVAHGRTAGAAKTGAGAAAAGENPAGNDETQGSSNSIKIISATKDNPIASYGGGFSQSDAMSATTNSTSAGASAGTASSAKSTGTGVGSSPSYGGASGTQSLNYSSATGASSAAQDPSSAAPNAGSEPASNVTSAAVPGPGTNTVASSAPPSELKSLHNSGHKRTSYASVHDGPMPSAYTGSDSSSSSSSSDPGMSGSQMEDQIALVENKIYGQTHAGEPLLKRVEKCEQDIFGKNRKGALDQRIQSLKKKCGL